MAAVFTRRLVSSARVSQKFRLYLSAKELSCSASLNFYCVGHPNIVNKSNNFLLKSVKLEPVCVGIRQFSENDPKQPQSPCKEKGEEEKGKKLSLLQRFKEMYKKYWYVLVPVHLVTSAAWFGGFYYLAKSGVDIVSILEGFNFNDTLIKPFRDSSMGYFAVAYALYKVATPLRYTVTLGGTTLSINYLKQWGYIKPVPTKDELKEMYLERKENLIERARERREEFWHKTDQLRGRKDEFIDDIKDKKESLEKSLMDRKQNFEQSLKDTQSKILQKKDEVFRLKDIKNTKD